MLTFTNMIVWHVLAILAVQALSSGRAAILGYTMPIFSALWGVAVFGERLRPRHVAGIVAAGLGVSFLLWHEFATHRRPAARRARHAGRRRGLGARHAADAAHEDRRADAGDRLLDDAGVDARHERRRRCCSSATAGPCRTRSTLAAIAYNAVLIFGLAQPIWLIMARNLPPIASSMSVMLIPVLGTRLGRMVAGRVAALAGRRGDRPRAARDRLGDVAGARSARTARAAEVGNL